MKQSLGLIALILFVTVITLVLAKAESSRAQRPTRTASEVSHR